MSVGGTLTLLVFFLLRAVSAVTMDRWMTCDFTPFFNSIFITSGRWADDNKKLSAMESNFLVKKIRTHIRLEPGTVKSAGQRFTY